MRPRHRLCAMLTVPALAFAVAAAPVRAVQAAELAAHRAVYGLKLEAPKGEVTAATGDMTYEVQDACDGWAVRQRLHMTITNRDGQDIEMVSDYVTWESKDGHRFRFHMKQLTDTAVTSQTEGEATTGPDGGEAHYTLPAENTKKLAPGTLLPMAHTEAIIAAAQAGRKFVGIPLFDGTSEAGGQDTNITVLDWKAAGAEGGRWEDLLKLPSTHVHVAFFTAKADASTPEYEVGMRYWDNGVGDDLRMDFGSFVMQGTMTEFTLLPHRC